MRINTEAHIHFTTVSSNYNRETFADTICIGCQAPIKTKPGKVGQATITVNGHAVGSHTMHEACGHEWFVNDAKAEVVVA